MNKAEIEGESMSFDFEKIKNEGEYLLITTDEWFYSCDGQSYRAAWGLCKLHRSKESFGFDPKNSTNWFMTVGTGPNALMIMGCRIHYAILCPDEPVNKECLNIS